eukprot:2512047-Prymnesium_polylepis.1
MNYLEAYYIARDELVALAKRHPGTFKRIRQHAIWMALRRQIIFLAKQAPKRAPPPSRRAPRL